MDYAFTTKVEGKLISDDKVVYKYSIINSEGETTEEAIRIFRANNINTFYSQHARIDDNGEIQPIDEERKFNRVLP